ncbi:hypothetical protein FIBSPDRAFT_900882 [Athelia psychrophila]|uniref:Uncharacterized protein n=1 Tax=Athelia psychrophila TaxID=1759441 RepID=A0A165XUC0_9AGAM|nr:hypothetical protein FIBSPDRAFT_900882 [Fibularhizoctonia sp. CBS 109695]
MNLKTQHDSPEGDPQLGAPVPSTGLKDSTPTRNRGYTRVGPTYTRGLYSSALQCASTAKPPLNPPVLPTFRLQKFLLSSPCYTSSRATGVRYYMRERRGWVRYDGRGGVGGNWFDQETLPSRQAPATPEFSFPKNSPHALLKGNQTRQLPRTLCPTKEVLATQQTQRWTELKCPKINWTTPRKHLAIGSCHLASTGGKSSARDIGGNTIVVKGPPEDPSETRLLPYCRYKRQAAPVDSERVRSTREWVVPQVSRLLDGLAEGLETDRWEEVRGVVGRELEQGILRERTGRRGSVDFSQEPIDRRGYPIWDATGGLTRQVRFRGSGRKTDRQRGAYIRFPTAASTLRGEGGNEHRESSEEYCGEEKEGRSSDGKTEVPEKISVSKDSVSEECPRRESEDTEERVDKPHEQPHEEGHCSPLL